MDKKTGFIGLRLPALLDDAARLAAEAQGLTLSEFARRALARELEEARK